MISIPLYTLLFIYLLFLAVFATFTIINFYHIIASASFTFASFFVSFLTFALTILTLYFTIQLLGGVDWKVAIVSFEFGSFVEFFTGPQSYASLATH